MCANLTKFEFIYPKKLLFHPLFLIISYLIVLKLYYRIRFGFDWIRLGVNMLVNRLTAWVMGGRWVSRAPDRSRAFVSRGLTLSGDLKINTTSLQIDGCVLGDVMAKSSVVTIGPSGSVVGTVHADTIFLAGQVTGKMVAAGQIACAASANFDGHMLATQLSIQAGAQIAGTMALRQVALPPVPMQDCA